MRPLPFLFALIVLTAGSLPAQQSHLSFSERAESYIEVEHEHVLWPSPETMVTDLRSPDDQTRLKALHRLGLTDAMAHRDIWSEGDQPKVIGKKVVTPDKLRLTYAALGSDATQQAILAVEFDELQTTLVAVVKLAAHGWQRIAQTTCWCKYDLTADEDDLSTFAQLRLAPGTQPASPQRYELVVHASGGGSGLYTQNEAHFRVHDGELREVLAFTSRRLSCPGTERTCTLERRWFNWAGSFGGPSGVLVESRGTFSDATLPPLLFEVRDLETRQLRHFTCTRIDWHEERFRYKRVKDSAKPCITSTPGSKRN